MKYCLSSKIFLHGKVYLCSSDSCVKLQSNCPWHILKGTHFDPVILSSDAHHMQLILFLCSSDTVNSEIFVRILFWRNLADAEFCQNKTLAKSLCGLLSKSNHVQVANFKCGI